MRALLFLMFLVPVIYSCGNARGSDTANAIDYDKTPLGTLKEEYSIVLSDPTRTDASIYFLRKHKDEVLKTMEIVEEVEVQKDVVLIFYRYTIGTDIAKKTAYMRKLDGLYLPYYTYFSQYDDDPFKNGKGEEGKALLKKADTWGESNIWWAY